MFLVFSLSGHAFSPDLSGEAYPRILLPVWEGFERETRFCLYISTSVYKRADTVGIIKSQHKAPIGFMLTHRLVYMSENGFNS